MRKFDSKATATGSLAQLIRSSLSPASYHPWVVGVDIGLWEIRMVLLERSRTGSLRVVACRNQAVDPLWDLDSPALVRALHEGIRGLAGKQGALEIWTGPVTDRVRMHHLELPRMKRAQLAQAVYWGMQREESFSPSETVLDFEVEAAFGGDRKDMEAVTGYVIPKEDRDTLARLFRQAGYPLYGIALPLHAILNQFRSGWIAVPEAPVALCTLGRTSSRISILSENRLVLSRSLPTGIEPLADVLLESLSPVPQRTLALRMILDLGREPWPHDPYDPEEVFNLLRPPLERMARQVDRTLDYYRIQVGGGAVVAQVYLAGALNESPRCREHFGRQLPAELVLVDPFADHPKATAAAVDIPESADERIAYTTAFGFALAAEDQAPNFLHTFRERERQVLFQRLNIGIFLVFAVLAIVLGTVYARQRATLANLHEEQARIQTRTLSARPLIEPDALIARAGRLQGDHRALVRNVDSRLPQAILAELGLLTPDFIRLETVSVNLGVGTRIDATTPRWLRLSGVVTGNPDMLETELSLFVRSLLASPLFVGVEVRNRVQSRRGGAIELDFALEIKLPPPPAGPAP